MSFWRVWILAVAYRYNNPEISEKEEQEELPALPVSILLSGS